MIKIKDESGKVLYVADDDATEPAPTPDCLECGCPTPEELKKKKEAEEAKD